MRTILALSLLVACAPEVEIVEQLEYVDGETLPPQVERVCVNELMVGTEAGDESLNGPDGDWIELHSPEGLWLRGWSLVDDDGDVWPLDAIQIEPGGFALLDANPDAPDADSNAFRLQADGGQLTLKAADGSFATITWGETLPDISLARVSDCCVGDQCWTATIGGTPGWSNEAL